MLRLAILSTLLVGLVLMPTTASQCLTNGSDMTCKGQGINFTVAGSILQLNWASTDKLDVELLSEYFPNLKVYFDLPCIIASGF